MNPFNQKVSANSRRQLTIALFTVMKQYPYKEITVTQITQEAELSRKTFYRLYTSKDDILNEYIETLFQEFSTETAQRDIHHYWDVVQLYFDFWEQREDIIMLFKDHGLLSMLVDATQEYADEVFIAVRSEKLFTTFSPLLPFMKAYTVGGMHHMLIAWITNGKPVSSATLIQMMKTGLQSQEI